MEKKMTNHQISDNPAVDWAAKTGIVIAALALILPLGVLRAWALSWIWQWYVVPHFNVSPLPVAIAFGLVIMINGVRSSLSVKKEYRDVPNEWAGMIAGPFVLLFIGWLGSFFV